MSRDSHETTAPWSHDKAITQIAEPRPVIRVALADPNPVVLVGLSTFLAEDGQIHIVGTATEAEDVATLVEDTSLDVLMIDARLYMGSHALRDALSTKSVAVLAMADEPILEELRIVFNAGVLGYSVKTEDARDLPEVVRRVHVGQLHLSSTVSRMMLEDAGAPRTTHIARPLTRREFDVLNLVAHGKSSREIAQRLGIKLRTVHTHRSRIMSKLDVHTAAALVSKAVTLGLVQLDSGSPYANASTSSVR